MADHPISFRLTPELFEELRQAAEVHGVSVSTFVRRAIEAQLHPVQRITLGPTNTVGFEPPRGYNLTFAGGLTL